MRRTDSASRIMSSAPICVLFLLDEIQRDLNAAAAGGANSRCESGRLRSNASSTVAPSESIGRENFVSPSCPATLRAACRETALPARSPELRGSLGRTTSSPSCSLDMSWSTLSFNAEKISLVSRIWRPRFAIFSVTSPNSSCSDSLPENGFACA